MTNVVRCCHCPFAWKKCRVGSVSRTQFAVTSMQNYSDGPAAIETTTVASALQMRPLRAENLIGRVTCLQLCLKLRCSQFHVETCTSTELNQYLIIGFMIPSHCVYQVEICWNPVSLVPLQHPFAAPSSALQCFLRSGSRNHLWDLSGFPEEDCNMHHSWFISNLFSTRSCNLWKSCVDIHFIFIHFCKLLIVFVCFMSRDLQNSTISHDARPGSKCWSCWNALNKSAKQTVGGSTTLLLHPRGFGNEGNAPQLSEVSAGSHKCNIQTERERPRESKGCMFVYFCVFNFVVH